MLKDLKTSSEIFQHAHIADYLRAIYKEKRDRNPQFSLRSWARAMGLNSSSLLSAILRKERRVSPMFAQYLESTLSLKENEKRYFRALIALSRPKLTSEEQYEINKYLDYLKQNLTTETHQ